MLKNYLKIALRNIKRQKGFSFINIAGLSIGIAAVILILLYVQYELSFDRFHENVDRIYRVAQEFPDYHQGKNQAAITPAPLAHAIVEEYPEVISATRFVKSTETLLIYGEKSFLENNFYFTDPQTFEIFSFKLLKGDLKTALDDPYSIIVSEQMAEKYFGDEEPLGKTISYKGSHDFTVTGILKNIPRNSHLTMDFIASFETYKLLTGTDFSKWYMSSLYTYLLLREDADPLQLESKLPALLEKYWNKEKAAQYRYFIQPLSKIHLHSQLIDDEIATNSDIKLIYLFSSIAFLILIIACINYMNLGTARSAQRSKEVGIRKVVGAQKRQLIKQFLGESTILTFIAFLVSILIVEMVLPTFNSFVERELSFNIAENFQFVLWIILLMLLIGISAGSYPALAISSFKPVSILSGKLGSPSKGKLFRNILVVIQFTISIVLIIGTFVIKNQLDHIRNMDVGYSKEQIVVLNLQDDEVTKNLKAIKTELQRNSNILTTSSSSNLPNNIISKGRADWPGKRDDIDLQICVGIVDYDFIDLYEIKIVEGRNFSKDFPSDENGAFLLNESAVKAIGWDSPIGKEFILTGHLGGGTGKVIGVMKDFNLHSLHQKIEPLYFYLNPNKYHRYLSIKIKGNNIPETLGYIKNAMRRFSPKYPFEYNFFNEIFDRAYKSEQTIGKMISIFAFVVIFVACLGLFGLAAFTTEQRTKEIGVRKVLGASVSELLVLLSKEFIKWVLLANIIAWPIAWYAMNKWLQNFAYRVNIGIWIFILSASLALIIALVTVSYQSIKAAVANPVESLRYE